MTPDIVTMTERRVVRRTFKRHSAEVTSDRLAEFLERYGDRLDGAERDMVSQVRFILEQVAEGAR